MAAMVIRTEDPVPGSIEEQAIDVMLSLSALSVLILGGGSFVACVRNRAATLHKQIAAVRAASGSSDEEAEKKKGVSGPPSAKVHPQTMV